MIDIYILKKFVYTQLKYIIQLLLYLLCVSKKKKKKNKNSSRLDYVDISKDMHVHTSK